MRALRERQAPSIALRLPSQLLAQLVTYRWMAFSPRSPGELAIHAHRRCAESAEAESERAVGPRATRALRILDADAVEGSPSGRTVVLDVLLGEVHVGRLAFSVPAAIEGRRGRARRRP